MRVGGNRPDGLHPGNVDYDDIHENGFAHLQRACEKLAEVQDADVDVIADALADAVYRRVEFEVLKRRLDVRSCYS